MEQTRSRILKTVSPILREWMGKNWENFESDSGERKRQGENFENWGDRCKEILGSKGNSEAFGAIESG